MSCDCTECKHIAAAGGVTIPSPGDVSSGIRDDLHLARNELTKARLVMDLLSQRLGVPSSPGREPNYEWLLEAVEELRERCGEIEQGGHHG